MVFEKVIFSYSAEHFKGTMKELTAKLDEINRSKELSLGFITSPVLVEQNPEPIVECVIQVKRIMKGFRRD